jgi:hypothetical protein
MYKKSSPTKFYIIAALLLLIITSCTKVIDLKLGNNTGQLVIEGNITNVRGPQYITLSQNVPFSNTNTYPPVSGATVTVTDGKGKIHQLNEGPAGTYSVDNFAGFAGETYTLNVLTGGKSYIASSVMPALVLLDSVTSESSLFNNSKNEQQITVYYKDPTAVANQYRFIMYVNGVQVNDVFAYNDEFDNGKDVSIDLIENDIDVYPGDTVKVEMQCIDKPIYTYWLTLMQQQNDGPGGGVTPSNPPTNITPATLGYFSAHTTQSLSFLVK